MLVGTFLHNPLWVSIKNGFLLSAPMSESVWGVLPTAVISHSLLTAPQVRSGLGKVKKLLHGLNCLTLQWECVSQRQFLPISYTGIHSQFSTRSTPQTAACLIFQSIQRFFHFYVELPCSFLDKISQCESLHIILPFPYAWGKLAKPLFCYVGEKNRNGCLNRYML